MRIQRFGNVVWFLAISSLMIGCPMVTDPNGTGSPSTPDANSEALADFAVADVNPNSARFQEDVSPRDYLGEVSAWYFGHST